MPSKSNLIPLIMSNKFQAQIDAFMDKVKATNGHEKEFLQAVH